MTPRNRKAALTLLLTAPAVAELTLGSVSVRMLWVVLLYVPIYGTGVLLIRELVRRVGGGWGSVLLLGLAYGLVEEGLALQSLTSPHLYGAADWGPRPFGVNAPYTELNLVYHAVFSVLIPIALVETVFRSHGRAPYLRRGGVILTAVGAVLGVGLLRVSVPPSEDPGYTLPGNAALTIALLVVALGVLALGVLPRLRKGTVPDRASRPVLAGLVCGAAAFGFLALLFPFGGSEYPAFLPKEWAPPAMAAAALMPVVAWLALRRWGGSASARLAAMSGALVAHTAFGLVAHTDTVADKVGLVVIGAVMVLLLAALARDGARDPVAS